MGTRRIALSALIVGALAALALPAIAGARAFTTGIFDSTFTGRNPAGPLQKASDAGASVVRIQVSWARTVGSKPANPQSPSDPSYSWGEWDRAVRAATAKGLQPLITFENAPRWAEGSNRPGTGTAKAGTWKPQPEAVGDFARALSVRYSGLFPDPNGGHLPRVRYYQPWNETNLFSHLTPQWKRENGVNKPASPSHYRTMLNAAYNQITRISGNFVVTAGLGPYGDPPSEGDRMAPAQFARELVCLDNSLDPKPCSEKPRFHALGQHLYPDVGPRERASGQDNVRVPDVGPKIERPLRVAYNEDLLVPDAPKELWITEFGWDSKPPISSGVEQGKHALWLEEAFYLLQKQGTDVVLWFRISDVPNPNDIRLRGTGLHFANGDKKKAHTAYRFPFVTERGGDGRVDYWGRAPAAGPVTIEKKSSAGIWQPVATDQTGGGRIFEGEISLGRDVDLRAKQGTDGSLTWRQN